MGTSRMTNLSGNVGPKVELQDSPVDSHENLKALLRAFRGHFDYGERVRGVVMKIKLQES